MCFKNFWNWLIGKSSNNVSVAINTTVSDNDELTSECDGNMLIAIINKSTLVSNDQVKLWTRGVAKQAREQAAVAWDIKPPKVVYRASEDTTEQGAWKIVLFDDADTAGALGYHADGPDGLPYGRVFVKITQQNKLSVSSVLSHEVLETMIDPQANYWVDNWPEKTSYALEIADPVESDYYTVDISGTTVEVSNFVLPAWFDPCPPAGSKFDWLGKLTKPFTMTSGGYVIIRDATSERSIFGASYPEWKKEMKLNSNSRTKRRQKMNDKKQ
jgi:hypothetical protein